MLKTIKITAVIMLSIMLISCTGSGGDKGRQRRDEGIPISTSTAIIKDIDREIELIGRVVPCSYVDVKSQADGILQAAHFKEGDFIKKGQMLFTIDMATYQKQLSQNSALVNKSKADIESAKANYAKSIALEKEAETNYKKAEAQKKELEANIKKNEFLAKNAFETEKRYAELLKNGYTTQEQYDTVETNARVMRSQLEADKESLRNASLAIESALASKETALAATKSQQALISDANAQLDAASAQKGISEINLDYCQISAPIDGRAGGLQVFPGNLIKSGNNQTLITINQISPIYVTCSLPEQYLTEIRERMTKGKITIRVKAKDSDKILDTGYLTFIDNQVDQNTGTVQIKGIFQNSQHNLWPGQFAVAYISLATIKSAIVIPAQAVQTGQNGNYLYIVKDGTAKLRNIKTDVSLNGETSITEGLSAGETVVTDGQLRLKDGTKVEIIKN